MSPTSDVALKLRGIHKTYSGKVHANRGIDLVVRSATIHGLLGENGAGKSTLVKILFGLIEPDEGDIEVWGARTSYRSPAEAIGDGIGMVEQHFSLIPPFSVVENLVLGREPRGRWGRVDLRRASSEIADLSKKYGFGIDPEARIGDLSVGVRQRVEILKTLYRGARLLILDEPTASLAPQETTELHQLMRQLRVQGHTIVFISHKLDEVIDLCDVVTVLRDGLVVGERQISRDERRSGIAREELEASLARMMIGRELPTVTRHRNNYLRPVLTLEGATDGDKLAPTDLVVRGGEIVGVAGVEGNGQRALIELILGVRPCREGRILLEGEDLGKWPISKRLERGIAHIPEDRHANGLVMTMSLAENISLGFQRQSVVARNRYWISRRRTRHFAADIIQRFRVRCSSSDVLAATLSGGNQQRLIVGREFARQPSLIIAAQPTRGLDLAATAFVHEELNSLCSQGSGVLLVSLDLTEILLLSDMIVVMSGGAIVGTARADDVDEESLGLWMTGRGSPIERISQGQ